MRILVYVHIYIYTYVYTCTHTHNIIHHQHIRAASLGMDGADKFQATRRFRIPGRLRLGFCRASVVQPVNPRIKRPGIQWCGRALALNRHSSQFLADLSPWQLAEDVHLSSKCADVWCCWYPSSYPRFFCRLHAYFLSKHLFFDDEKR